MQAPPQAEGTTNLRQQESEDPTTSLLLPSRGIAISETPPAVQIAATGPSNENLRQQLWLAARLTFSSSRFRDLN